LVLLAVGILGSGYLFYNSGQGVTVAGAERISEKYLASLDNSDLSISEIMEFEYNYYIIYDEESTGMGAFEMLIDKTTGRIFPEYGPNMMWNIKYGHGGMMGIPDDVMSGSGGMMGEQGGMMAEPDDYMSGYLSRDTVGEPLSGEEALELAHDFLDKVLPGAEAEDPHPFYGYYTLHVEEDGEITGMLSVNSYSGAVWYHSWHGTYIGSLEEH
jgi:hypothetical protein